MTNEKECISEQIQDLLKQINLSLSYVFSKVLEDSALTFHQVYIMKVIKKKPSINLTTLCNDLKLSKGAMSLTINKLVERGYVFRRENSSDRRNRDIILTEQGEEVLNNTIKKSREAYNKLTHNLTTEDLQEIKKSLAKLNKSICGVMQQNWPMNEE